MKKIILAALATVLVAGAANAQRQSLAPIAPGDNWSLTLKGGIAAPLKAKNGASWGDNIRGGFGVETRKQIAPAFGLGVEGEWLFNSSTWNKGMTNKTVFDQMYVGMFGAVNLNNLFAGYAGQPRLFEVELVGGIGWIHQFGHKSLISSRRRNDVGAKTGINLNFNLGESKAWTIGLQPAILWNLTNDNYEAWSPNAADFRLSVAATYHFACSNGTNSFAFAEACDYTPYNEQINALRAEVANAQAANADLTSANAALKAQLDECRKRPAPVVTNTVVETNNTLESVRYIFYRIGSSVITADQRPNVEMIAQYMKNNPKSTVDIKGYASKDGNLEFNKKLAAKRAEAVKTMLVNKYGIAADRIKAEGQGIGEMFKEESWNRVAICILSE